MSADPRDPQGPVRFRYSSGLGHMPAYMVAGHPFITGSAALAASGGEHTISFPYVTRKITVIVNGDTPIRVHFRSDDVDRVIDGNHFITLDGDEESMTFNIKCKEIFISNAHATNAAGYTVYAELTSIATASMYVLTGSGITV